jgi:hypothetical protein
MDSVKKNSQRSKVISFVGSSSNYSSSIEERRSKGSYFDLPKAKKRRAEDKKMVGKSERDPFEDSVSVETGKMLL